MPLAAGLVIGATVAPRLMISHAAGPFAALDLMSCTKGSSPAAHSSGASNMRGSLPILTICSDCLRVFSGAMRHAVGVPPLNSGCNPTTW